MVLGDCATLLQTMRWISIFLGIAAATLAHGQQSPLRNIGAPLIIYVNSNAKGDPEGYLFTRSYSEKNQTVSEIIRADSFSVKSKGVSCEVTMTNAFVYRTTFSVSPSKHASDVTQLRFLAGTYSTEFFVGTDLIFNDSVMPLSEANLGKIASANAVNQSKAVPVKK